MTFFIISIVTKPRHHGTKQLILAFSFNELSREIEVRSVATCNGFSKNCLNSVIVNEVTWGIQTDRRHTSWLFTSAAKKLNMGLAKNTPVNVSSSQRLLMYLPRNQMTNN